MTYDRHLGCRSLTYAWRRAATRATQRGREPHASDVEGNIRFDFHLREGRPSRCWPFADLVGQLEQLDDNGSVRVLLEILGGKVLVALPHKLVAPAKEVA